MGTNFHFLTISVNSHDVAELLSIHNLRLLTHVVVSTPHSLSHEKKNKMRRKDEGTWGKKEKEAFFSFSLFFFRMAAVEKKIRRRKFFPFLRIPGLFSRQYFPPLIFPILISAFAFILPCDDFRWKQNPCGPKLTKWDVQWAEAYEVGCSVDRS